MAEIYKENNLRQNKLEAKYQKSYYGKAKEIELNGFKYLKSYNTIVCAITPSNEFIRLWDGWSATTSKHVNDFRENNGMKAISKKEWKKLPVDKEYEKYNVPEQVKKVDMNYKVTWY